jgi:hypothetical protein
MRTKPPPADSQRARATADVVGAVVTGFVTVTAGGAIGNTLPV